MIVALHTTKALITATGKSNYRYVVQHTHTYRLLQLLCTNPSAAGPSSHAV